MERGKAYCKHCDRTGHNSIVEVGCPICKRPLEIISLAVDLLVEHEGKLALVERRGGTWALPGGFVEYNETLEDAARREAAEELGASKVTLLRQFHTYGDPERDWPRRVVTVAYIAMADRVATFRKSTRERRAALREEGLTDVRLVPFGKLPGLAFDHGEIVADYLGERQQLLPLRHRRRPAPSPPDEQPVRAPSRFPRPRLAGASRAGRERRG